MKSHMQILNMPEIVPLRKTNKTKLNIDAISVEVCIESGCNFRDTTQPLGVPYVF